MKNVDELQKGNGVFVVFTPVYCSVWVNVAFKEDGGKGESVVAVDEVVVYVVDF